MSKEKRSSPPSSTEEENAPPNRKRAALSESPDDAVSLLLLLSRSPCDPDRSVRTKTSPQLPQLPQLGPLGHYRRRNSSSRREGLGRRVVRFAPQGRSHVVSHVSDDEDERETTTCSSSSHKARTWFASQASSRRHTIDQSPVVGEMSNIPLFAMALAPPPRLPNVEFGTVVGVKSRD